MRDLGEKALKVLGIAGPRELYSLFRCTNLREFFRITVNCGYLLPAGQVGEQLAG